MTRYNSVMIKTFADKRTRDLCLHGSAKRFPPDITDQWRICFRFVDGDAYDVEVCDYH